LQRRAECRRTRSSRGAEYVGPLDFTMNTRHGVLDHAQAALRALTARSSTPAIATGKPATVARFIGIAVFRLRQSNLRKHSPGQRSFERRLWSRNRFQDCISIMNARQFRY